ncbi:hypothetical protein [Agromyces larvae]|uniref:Glycerophosphoryl diester phosphodiesterase membrane domain-containing protein n=1 Tax=Agromyces larvae TaxID=2929802 RepID=A0ABY4C3C6_9MICO|nr:hypothetical protein [Agromyces larvae]UOE44531.1 hypothetical protein MTO99_01685 [Agromyces larvae]
MSDQEWQAPGGGAWPPQVPPAPAAQPGYPQPGYPQPGYQQSGYSQQPGHDQQPGYPAPGAPAGWTPPPKPGLLPLRPLGFGTLLWAPFRTLRRNPAPTFGTGLLVQLATVVATAAVVVPFMFILLDRTGSAAGEDADTLFAGAVGGFLLLMLVPIAVSVVASALVQGVMVVEVATGTLGEKLGFGALWRRAARRIWPLIGWTLLLSAAVLLAVLSVVVVVVIAAMLGPVGLAVGVVFAIVAGLGLVALGAWLGVKTSLVPSIIVLEEAGIRRAVARSWRLTDGYFWRTLGVELLVAVILSTASNVVVQPISFLGGMLSVLIDPTGTGSGAVVLIVLTVVSTVLSLLIGAITLVVQSAVIAVIYLDLRMRKEGLDLELERHVELRDAGHPVGDPYLPRPVAPVPAPASPGAPYGWA